MTNRLENYSMLASGQRNYGGIRYQTQRICCCVPILKFVHLGPRMKCMRHFMCASIGSSFLKLMQVLCLCYLEPTLLRKVIVICLTCHLSKDLARALGLIMSKMSTIK